MELLHSVWLLQLLLEYVEVTLVDPCQGVLALVGVLLLGVVGADGGLHVVLGARPTSCTWQRCIKSPVKLSKR